MTQPSKFVERTVQQKVPAFRKRSQPLGDLGEEDDMTAARSDRMAKAIKSARLLAGGQEVEDQAGGSGHDSQGMIEFAHQVDDKSTYMETVQKTEYNEINKDVFFAEHWLVERFGYTISYRARIGFCRHTQAYKLYMRRENLKESPTVASIILTELKEILDYIKETLKAIDESVANKQPLFHYGPEENRNVKHPAFWEHADGFLSSSMTARMRFLHVRGDRYQFIINSPIVLGSKRFPTDYIGPVFFFCRKDLDEFLEAADKLVAKLDPAEL